MPAQFKRYSSILLTEKPEGDVPESGPEPSGESGISEKSNVENDKHDGNDEIKPEAEKNEKDEIEKPEIDKDAIVETDGVSESSVENVSGSSSAAGGASAPPSGNSNNNNNNNNNNNDNDEPNEIVTNAGTGLYPPLLAIPMKDRPPLPGRPFAINITDPEVIRSIYTIIDKREPYFVLFHVKDPNEGDTDVINLSLIHI